MTAFTSFLQHFICPLCMKTFSSPGQLQTHFDQLHETENDSAVVSQHNNFALKGGLCTV